MVSAKELGERIYLYRKQHGITQQDISNQLFVDNKTVSRWENGLGYPDLESTYRLSKLFKCSIDEFLGDSDLPIQKHNKLEKLKLLNIFSLIFTLILAIILISIKFTYTNYLIISNRVVIVILYSILTICFTLSPFITNIKGIKLRSCIKIFVDLLFITLLSLFLFF